jgi:hypothetical protein
MKDNGFEEVVKVLDLLDSIVLFEQEHPYEERKIGRDVSQSGIVVSTAYTNDEGHETALLDKNGVHPVERYKGVAEAIVGHEKWLKFAHIADGVEVVRLGWQDFENEERVILRAK